MKRIQNIIILLLTYNVVIAGCGKCSGDLAKHKSTDPIKKTSMNSLVTAVPEDGIIEGIIITSCGTCKLGVIKGGCSLSVKIGETVYPVEGTGIHDHGDAHSREGFCSAVRVAWVKGQMKENVFHAESFVLVGNSE